MSQKSDLCEAGFSGEQAEAIIRIIEQSSSKGNDEIKRLMEKTRRQVLVFIIAGIALQASLIYALFKKLFMLKGFQYVESVSVLEFAAALFGS